MSAFWSDVLGYREVSSGDGWVAIGPVGDRTSETAMRGHAQPPLIAFVVVPEDKLVKNRVHVDVTPIDRSQDEEVDRLVGLGARKIDIGQASTPWVVMADPENNEFCVMPALD
jgi:hypothetical protein